MVTGIDSFKEWFKSREEQYDILEKLGEYLDAAYAEGLRTIMESVDAVKSADFKIAFDPTLVRGIVAGVAIGIIGSILYRKIKILPQNKKK